jgi:hypothetical protein
MTSPIIHTTPTVSPRGGAESHMYELHTGVEILIEEDDGVRVATNQVIRMDRMSGETWVLDLAAKRWVGIKEPEA